ncbi:MAG: TraB/GumN family protein [Eubacteriales bacterium]|nr:TraB/GumN family protein [Eubacteriales bacterium]
MTKKNRRVALLLLCALFLGGCAVKEAEPCVGICYRVTGGKNEMVLLGSIHVGNQAMSRYGDELEAAVAQADVFVFECDNDNAEAREASARLTASDTPLREQVSAETYERLSLVAQSHGLSMEQLDKLRPWAVTSTLSTLAAAAELGVRNASSALAMGVEQTLLRRVKGKEIRYLETAEEQLEILDGFSAALQEEMLRSTCDLILKAEPTSLADWPEWWQTGDSAAFAAAYERENQMGDPALTAEYHDQLVTGRNQKMAQELRRLLESDERHSYFVTVGLLHLVLPGDSIPDELEKMGYTVEQVGERETAT